LLVLANPWDAGSARLIEGTGAKALATTSAGIAWTHGFPDGDTLPLELLVSSVRAILRVTRLPLTVDMEGGYADNPVGCGGRSEPLFDSARSYAELNALFSATPER